MSHYSSVKTQINDLGALAAAAKEMGFGFLENARPRGYSTGAVCDVVVKLKGKYDVGFVKQADGTYAMTCDWYMGYVQKEIGENGGLFMQNYAYQKISREAGARGYSVQRNLEKDGKIKMRIVGL
jgi:hypothetical protein